MNYLKVQWFQFYIVPDLKALLKVVIWELSKSSTPDSNQNELNKNGFNSSKVTQMYSRKDGRILPLFLLHLSCNKISKRFLIKSLFKIRIDIENYIAPRKAVQCWNCQCFFHISANININPKCVCCWTCWDSHKSNLTKIIVLYVINFCK